MAELAGFPELEAAWRERWKLRLPPVVEAQFAARVGPRSRARQARGLAGIGALVVWAGSIELVSGWHAFAAAMPWRLGEALLCLAGAWGLGRAAARPWLAGLCYGVPMLGLMATILAAGWAALPVYQDRYVLFSILSMGLALGAVPAPLGTAASVSAASCVAYPLLVVTTLPALSGRLAEHALLAFGTGGAAIMVAWRTEVALRRSFLERLRYEAAAAELNLMNAQLLRACTTDALTGLANRRHFETEGARLWASPPGAGLGAVLIDVDYFKSFNDSAGHVAGDSCLRAVAQTVAGALRKSDCRVARYGGEEFAAIVPDVDRAELEELGERLRGAVACLELPHPGLDGRLVSVSVGLAWCRQPRDGQTLDTLLMEADRALYRAKELGRDRVSWDLPQTPRQPAAAGLTWTARQTF